MSLPKAKKTKQLNKKELIKLAEKVNKSFTEELRYVIETKLKNGYQLSPYTYRFS